MQFLKQMNKENKETLNLSSVAKNVIARQRLLFNRLMALDLGMNVKFAEGGKPEDPEKNPWSQIEIDKSQATCRA